MMMMRRSLLMNLNLRLLTGLEVSSPGEIMITGVEVSSPGEIIIAEA